MPNLFDCCSKSNNAFNDLQAMKNKLEIEKDLQEKQYKLDQERKYRETHIFKTPEEALDYLEQDDSHFISWVLGSLSYDPINKVFNSYEQDFSLDGVMCWDVLRHYSRENLLKTVNEHHKKVQERYPETHSGEWWLDEFGFLKHWHIID